MRLIDADALLKVPNVRKVEEYDETGEFISYLAVPVEAIEESPTIEAEPVRHGEWLATSWRTKCSLCGFAGSIYDQPVNPFKYCPHCGAKMDGGASDENA